MRHLGRRTFNVATGLSAILFVATAGLLIMTLHRVREYDSAGTDAQGEPVFLWSLTSLDGELAFRKMSPLEVPTVGWQVNFVDETKFDSRLGEIEMQDVRQHCHRIVGFGYGVESDSWIVLVPHWAMLILFVTCPALWGLFRWRSVSGREKAKEETPPIR